MSTEQEVEYEEEEEEEEYRDEPRITRLTKMLGRFSSPEECFIKAGKFVKKAEENADKDFIDITIERSSRVFSVFSLTQKVCHLFLKDAYENNKFNINMLTKIDIPKVLRLKKSEKVVFASLTSPKPNAKEAYGIYLFFMDLKEKISSIPQNEVPDEVRKQIIKDLFIRLVSNTIIFFDYIDEHIESVNQYFRDINEKFCKHSTLIKLKNIFNSYNNLREPAKHLIHLYYSEMIKEEIISKDDDHINETNITSQLKSCHSNTYQERLLDDILKMVEAKNHPNEIYWALEEKGSKTGIKHNKNDDDE